MFAVQDEITRAIVNALKVNSADKTSQGWLGCTMMKLNRMQEAQQWITRAGAGPWSNCQPAVAAPRPVTELDNDVRAVSCVANGVCWAIGASVGADNVTVHQIISRWNGKKWVG